MELTLYDQSWLSEAKSKALPGSWTCEEVFNNIDKSGGVYLSVLREWFLAHPMPSKGKKKHMKKALESLKDHDHLGAVNELCWHRFMSDFDLNPEVLLEGHNKKPDFKGASTSGAEFYCEVTTLNVSSKDAEFSACEESAPLDHKTEISRILSKATEEKAEQLKFCEKAQKAMVFVVFDYSTFSGLGTQRSVALADVLLQTSKGLQTMQPYLSAIIYVERYVRRGWCRLRVSQSAVYHNPLADNPLPLDVFGCFRQYSLNSYSSVEPKTIDIAVF